MGATIAANEKDMMIIAKSDQRDEDLRAMLRLPNILSIAKNLS